MKYELPIIEILQANDPAIAGKVFVPPTEIQNMGFISLLEKNDAQAKLYSSAEMDVVIVPGLYIDRQGHRLGKGKGWYDQLLVKSSRVFLEADNSSFASLPQTIFVGYHWQFVNSLPYEAHDIRIMYFVSEKEILSFIDPNEY